jgi:hypothetical protein
MFGSALMMVALLGAGDPDGIVRTAPNTTVSLDANAVAPVAPSVAGATQDAAPHGLSTDQQIDRWLESRNPDAVPFAQSDDAMQPERRMHSEFTASVGTGGYRDYGAAVSVPIGENGWLGLSYRQTENDYRGWGYGPGEPSPLFFDDSGYVFPGRSDRSRAWEYERRLMRPGGPPTIGGSLTPTAED